MEKIKVHLCYKGKELKKGLSKREKEGMNGCVRVDGLGSLG